MDGRRQPTPTPALVSPMESPWRLSRQRQPRQQPDASRSRVLAVSSLGPGPRDRESAPHGAGRRPVITGSTMSDTLHPAGRSTVHGAPPLSASQAGFGLPAGACDLGPGPCQPLLRPYHGGGRLGWEPLGRGTSRHVPPGWPRRYAPSVVNPLRSPGPAWAALRSPQRPAPPSPLCGCRSAAHRRWQPAATLSPGPPLRISGYYRRLIIILQAWLIALPLPTHGVEHRPGAAGCARDDTSSPTPASPTSTSTPGGLALPDSHLAALASSYPGRTLQTEISSAPSQAHRPTICS